MSFETVYWKDGKVVILDQLKLPRETIYHAYGDPSEVVEAIRRMIVRGAPAIGVTAALGLALAARHETKNKLESARESFSAWAKRFAETRPTAVNLFWAIDRMKKKSDQNFSNTETWAAELLKEAQSIREEDIAACKRMGSFGAELISDGARVLTHCNAGALATAGWGTALGVVRSAVAQGKKVAVIADETRPFLQGSRLTAWELAQDQIPVTLITDNMAGHLMAHKEIDLVIVGGDRVAANGDVANKIGTYTVAILAHEHRIPFYVAVPFSSIDLSCPNGSAIVIEERDPQEVVQFAGVPVAPSGTRARHPAFDVTPARFISAIVTERGIARAPFDQTLKNMR